MDYEGIVYRPPSEARSFILQVTIGCSNNTCTFCNMYKDKRFRVRSLDEVFADIDEVSASSGKYVRRIFLADGDALVLPTEQLLSILRKLDDAFPNAERITSYATPSDVLRKTPAELQALKEAGLSMVYTGAESGSNAVLTEIKKGVSAEEIIEAGLKLKETGIRNSITLISGLGGKPKLAEHALASAKLISAIRPEYVGFLTLMLEPGTPMKKAVQDGLFELLTPEDVVEEMSLFLQNVNSPGTVFRANHASNYMLLKGTLNDDIPAMLSQIEEIRRRHGYRSETWRAL